MGLNLEGRIKALEEGTPGGYRTYDVAGNVVISSSLPTLEWFSWAGSVLSGRSKAARAELLEQLAHSARAADHSLIHEFLLAVQGPLAVEQPPNSAPGRRKPR